MQLKFSPCQSDTKETIIEVTGSDSLTIDGELLEFNPESIEWPDIMAQTGGKILEAHRIDGAWSELYVTVMRFYKDSCTAWDTGEYVNAQPEVPQ